MKLLFCLNCADVVMLKSKRRTCYCGASSGHYDIDGTVVFMNGPSVPIGFANSSLKFAIENQPNHGQGKEFTAFVIPKFCSSVIRPQEN